MVKIISDGKIKTFYTKCLHCATDFTYQLEDVQTEKEEDSLFEVKTVKCPSCEENEVATLLTKEEYGKMFLHYPYVGHYGGCGV